MASELLSIAIKLGNGMAFTMNFHGPHSVVSLTRVTLDCAMVVDANPTFKSPIARPVENSVAFAGNSTISVESVVLVTRVKVK